MTGVTLESLAERTATHGKEIGDLRAEVKAIWRTIYWASGVCFGFGAVAAILAPKVVKALGLG